MALAAAAGNPVWVLCVTNGDQGGRPGEVGVDHSLDPEIRLEELRCACREMGIAEPIFLGYRDSGMEGWGAPEGSLSKADSEEVVQRMIEVIRRLRPAVIVTFDPGGIYGHPDHVKCSATATEAYRPGRRRTWRPRRPIPSGHAALASCRHARGDGGGASPLRRHDPAERGRPAPAGSLRAARPARRRDNDDRGDRRSAGPQARRARLSRQPDARPTLDDPEVRAGLEQMFGHETFVRVDPAPQAGEREKLPMALEWGGR